MPNAHVCVFDGTLHMCQKSILCNDDQVSQATCNNLLNNTKCFPIKSLNVSMPKKSHIALIFLIFGKIYPNYIKLPKKKKKKKELSQTLKHVSKCEKLFFPTKKKDAFLKKIAIFFMKKGNLWRKILFYFFESSNS
jgi:hypothetical protein